MMIKRILLGAASAAGVTLAGLAGFTALTTARVSRAFPARGRVIAAGGERVHIVERGTGAPIVLVHGLAGNLGHYAYGVVDRLAASHRVIALDRPGSGHSPRARGARANLRAQGDTVAAVIAALQLERPLLVGHSLGGAVALATALDHPDRVGGLALIAPLTHPVSKRPDVFRLLALRSPLTRLLVGWTIAVPLAIRHRERTMATLFGPDPAPDDFATRGGGLLSLRPSAFVAASTDLVASQQDLSGMVRRYGSLAMPVGVLYGDGDRILDHREQGEVLRDEIPGVEVDLVAGAGHMLPITRVDAVAEFVERQATRMSGSRG